MSISWEAQEYRFREKNTDWFWALGVVGVVLATTLIVLGDLLFGIFVIIGVVALAIQSVRRPRTLKYSIDDRGVRIGEVFYSYSTLESFWVDDDPSVHRLLLKSQKFFSPLITIPLGDTSPDSVRDFLLGFLDEEEHTVPFIDRIAEHVGF